MPTVRNADLNSSMLRLTRKPGMASSLSSVPPVCPRPRPDIIGTITPHAAANGPRISEVLSPTPPVLCLSTFTPAKFDKSTRTPESVIARVRFAVSRSVIPRMQIAISKADS